MVVVCSTVHLRKPPDSFVQLLLLQQLLLLRKICMPCFTDINKPNKEGCRTRLNASICLAVPNCQWFDCWSQTNPVDTLRTAIASSKRTMEVRTLWDQALLGNWYRLTFNLKLVVTHLQQH